MDTNRSSIQEALDASTLRSLIESGAARMTRIAAGLSYGEMGRAVDVQPSTIYRWEKQLRRPRVGAAASRYLRVLQELMAR